MTTQTDAHAGAQAGSIERDTAHTAGAGQTTLLKTAGDAASDAAALLSDAAQAAGRHAKDAASDLAAEANQNVQGLLNTQLAAGADIAGHLAGAVRVAANSLRSDSPQLAGIIGTAAGTIEDFSQTVRGKSAEELLRSASDFTRRQPAAAFGAAALAGFFLFRVLKAGGRDASQNPGQHGPGRYEPGQVGSNQYGSSQQGSNPYGSSQHGSNHGV
jgi:hypothetical protein